MRKEVGHEIEVSLTMSGSISKPFRAQCFNVKGNTEVRRGIDHGKTRF